MVGSYRKSKSLQRMDSGSKIAPYLYEGRCQVCLTHCEAPGKTMVASEKLGTPQYLSNNPF